MLEQGIEIWRKPRVINFLITIIMELVSKQGLRNMRKEELVEFTDTLQKQFKNVIADNGGVAKALEESKARYEVIKADNKKVSELLKDANSKIKGRESEIQSLNDYITIMERRIKIVSVLLGLMTIAFITMFTLI